MVSRLLKNIWKISFINKEVRSSNSSCLIIGFPRSGTSIVSLLVSLCGYNFGSKEELKKPSDINPLGFYENKKIGFILNKLMNQAKIERSYYFGLNSFRAKGFLNRIKRVIYRNKLVAQLEGLSNSGKFGMKTTPQLAYFLSKILSNNKLIAVYRNPVSCCVSHSKILYNGDTFSQLLEYWKESNLDLIFHVISKGGILVKYEDLMDPNLSQEKLATISKYLEAEYTDHPMKYLKPDLNRNKLSNCADIDVNDLSESVVSVYKTLESIKI